MVPLDGLGVNWLTTSDLFSYENNIYRTLLTFIKVKINYYIDNYQDSCPVIQALLLHF